MNKPENKNKNENILLIKKQLEEKIREVDEKNIEISSQNDKIQKNNLELKRLNRKLKANESILLKAYNSLKSKEKELEDKNHELKVQNEQLKNQQEEILNQQTRLIAMNSELTGAKELISNQNDTLKNQKKHLEIEVAQRTQDLQNTNQILKEQNSQLEQYAFITAHNLRGPLSRILGLGSLLDNQQTHSEERGFIVNKIVQSAYELDEIVKDLNAIIEIKERSLDNLSDLDLTEKIEKTKKILATQIEVTNAQIHIDLQECRVIKAHEPYVESILYNLLSNAIKYKSRLNPVIHIKTKLLPNNKVCLSIQDNGVGMDLIKYKNKLFRLYQRLNEELPGKGMGLYMVKTQVEAMNGEIKVDSQLGRGSTFKIYLNC